MPTIETAPRPRGSKRLAILDTAAALFRSSGFRQTSLRDIASAVGISHQGVARHFASKDEILTELLDRVERPDASRLSFMDAPDLLPGLADSIDTLPDRGELVLTLAGEATSAAHPAHTTLQRLLSGLVWRLTEAAERVRSAGGISADRDPRRVAIHLVAGWYGLHLMQSHLGADIGLLNRLRRAEALCALPVAAHRPPARASETPWVFTPPRLPGTTPDEDGYSKGRARRALIVEAATGLYAAHGYAAGSMREVAERAGVAKATLFHHFPTKEALLEAVLAGRDARGGRVMDTVGAASAADFIRSLPGSARRNAHNEPGLIEVYSVLAGEATRADHPARPHFARRSAALVKHMTTLFNDAQVAGDLAPGRDPDHEAIWFLALWDGLQVQSLYDPTSVNVADQLDAHLADVLPVAGEG